MEGRVRQCLGYILYLCWGWGLKRGLNCRMLTHARIWLEGEDHRTQEEVEGRLFA